ncbi:MAG: efflux RND transporter periplasmic adaptor subunit [Candidatus Aminicenantales bacterium]
MNKKTTLLSLFIGVAAIVAAFLLQGCRNQEERGRIIASGTIEAVEVSVAAKTSGQIEKIFVEEGARVQTGDTLAVIDSTSLAIQLRQAEAAVDLAESQLELLLKGARVEDIRQVEEAAKQAEAQLNLAAEDLERIQNLYAKESATLKMKQDAETRFQVAKAQHVAARQALQKVRTLSRPEEVKAAQARLAQAEAGGDLLKKTIADATIISPTAGVVTHKAMEPGEFVAPGRTLLTIADLDNVRLSIYVTEVDLGRVRLGQRTEVRIDSHPGRVFSGTVIFISPEAEFTPKNVQTREERVKLVYRVKIEIPNPEGILKPGMPADASIPVALPAGR